MSFSKLSEGMKIRQEKSIRNIINLYRDNIDNEKKQINIEYTYEFNLNPYEGIGRASFLSLRMGEDKLYVVRSIDDFIERFERGEDIEFGKQFTFSPYEHEFKHEDREFINLIRLLHQNYKLNYSANNRSDGENTFRGRRMLLTPSVLKSFFNLMDNRVFNATIMGNKYNDVIIVNEDLPFLMEIKEEDKALRVKLGSNENLTPLTSNGEYFFMEGRIFKISDKQRKKLLPLYNEIIIANGGSLLVEEELKESFISEVLPNIKNIINLEIEEKVKESIYDPGFSCEIYLDKDEDIIIGQVKFLYGDMTINPFTSKDSTYNSSERILLRDMEKETTILNLLEVSEFKVRNGDIYMEDEEEIFNFIKNIIPQLQEYSNVYYTGSFKEINILDSSYYSGGLRLSDNLDMLDFNFEIKGIDQSELEQVFKDLRENKKYYRLKNGSFLDLGNRELGNISNMMEYFNTSIPVFRTMYLDNYLDDNRLGFIKKNLKFKNLVQDIKESEDIEYELPKGLEATLREYQVSGFKWLKTLSKYGLGGILADDMGLGKTLQVLTFLLSESQEKEQMPNLIVVPTSLVYNWEAEIAKFTPSLKSLIISGDKEERVELAKKIHEHDIIITSYPLIRRDVELYEDYQFRYCILDEAQHIKNHKSISARSVKKLKANNYFALTGTPMENSLLELWSIFDFLMPGYLSSSSDFIKKYERPIVRDEEESALKDLNNHIRPFILRRLKKDVLKELPDKIEQKVVVEMSKEEKTLYLAYLKSIKDEIEVEIDEKGIGRSQMKILAGLTRLRQICCYPGLFIEGYTGGSSKLDSLEEILEDAISGGHRILVFSQFTTMLKIIKDLLEKKEIGVMYLDGSTPMEERGQLVQEFNQGKGEVFLISLKAGGTGLNLTGADMVIHYDPWWNPAVEEQATDRAHRIGQKNIVQVMKLITKGTIEEKIFQLQERKKEMIDKVITEGETFVSKLTVDEIRSLFDI